MNSWRSAGASARVRPNPEQGATADTGQRTCRYFTIHSVRCKSRLDWAEFRSGENGGPFRCRHRWDPLAERIERVCQNHALN